MITQQLVKEWPGRYKPHIYFSSGWWRVTLWPKRGDVKLWNQAHTYAAKLNDVRPKESMRKCRHYGATFDPLGWPTGESLEVCNSCGMTRTHGEQGASDWVWVVDLNAARLEIQKALDSL